MPRYRVRIQRQYIHETTIEVDADSVAKAEQEAYNQIGNQVLSIKDIVPGGDYAEVMNVILP